MKDKYGREIDYLRVSVTQRCNLNCVYCGKADCGKKESELPAETIVRAVEAFAACGIRKVRLTGGEPLVRSDICDIAAGIRAVPGIETLALTTNAVLLRQYARGLAEAGVDSINISLDSTDGSTYRRLTGADVLERVIAGIGAAQQEGITKIKINAVLIRGVNDAQADGLIRIAQNNPIDVRFIELMPFSDLGEAADKRITTDELLARFPFLTPLESEEKSTAAYYSADGFCGRVGFISPVSRKFCGDCNRVRLLSDGKVKPCLGCDAAYDILPYLDDRETLLREIRRIIFEKPAGHSFENHNTVHGLNRTGG